MGVMVLEKGGRCVHINIQVHATYERWTLIA
jgi:hypothetical protein